MNRAGKRQNSIWILAVFCIYLLFVLYHTVQNLLSYDEGHSMGRSGDTTGMAEDEKNGRSAGQPKWKVVVDLDAFRISVYKAGTLQKTYPCSGGKPATPSPTGEFRIISKGEWGEGFGGAWMGLNVPWGNYGIHGTVFPWVIGKYHASKGCIRMLKKDAKELIKLVPCGTPVQIIQNKRKFRPLQSGDTGSDVRDTEAALKILGYYRGPLDGMFGKKLFRALLEFQEDNGLKATGTIDKKTFELAGKLGREAEENSGEIPQIHPQ